MLYEVITDYDLDQFTRWYGQSGTPTIEVVEQFNEEKEEYRLVLKQSCPPTPGQPEKKPFHLPVAIGLLGQDGKNIRITDEDTSYNFV